MQLFKDTHEDNQKVLGTLLSLKDDLPLWDGFAQGQVSLNFTLYFTKPYFVWCSLVCAFLRQRGSIHTLDNDMVYICRILDV